MFRFEIFRKELLGADPKTHAFQNVCRFPDIQCQRFAVFALTIPYYGTFDPKNYR